VLVHDVDLEITRPTRGKVPTDLALVDAGILPSEIGVQFSVTRWLEAFFAIFILITLSYLKSKFAQLV